MKAEYCWKINFKDLWEWHQYLSCISLITLKKNLLRSDNHPIPKRAPLYGNIAKSTYPLERCSWTPNSQALSFLLRCLETHTQLTNLLSPTPTHTIPHKIYYHLFNLSPTLAQNSKQRNIEMDTSEAPPNKN